MPLLPHHARQLHLALADAASGTPRQWWHLEVAAQLSSGPASWSVKALIWLLYKLGPDRLVPLLAGLGLSGLQPYQLRNHSNANRATDAALVAVCLLGSLLGLTSLNASRQLLLVLTAVLGGMACGLLTLIQARRQRLEIIAIHSEIAATLTPSEAALGLTALLSAAGLSFDEARSRAAQLASHPASLTATDMLQLGLAAPAQAYIWLAAWRSSLAWLVGIAAVAWPCWLTAANWQFLPALLGVTLMYFVVQGHQPAWWRQALRTCLIGAGCYLAGWLLHRY